MPRAGRLAGAFLLAAGAVLSVSPAFAQPAAPTGFEVAQAGSIKAKLAWNAPAAGAGIVRHEVRFRAGSAAFPVEWTNIPSSRPGQANAAGYLLDGLIAETDYDFELRAVSGDGDGTAASASATTLPPFTARFTPLKTYYEGTHVTMTIVFTAAIDKPTLERGVAVHGGRIAVREEPGQPETWHISATSTRGRDVTFFLLATSANRCGMQGALCSTLGEPLTETLQGIVPHVPSVTLALSLATISEDSGVTAVTASLDKTWHEDVTVSVSASPVTPATASDFDLSSTTTLTIAADDKTSTGAVTVTAVDNDAQAANRQVTVSGEVTAPDYVPDPDAVTLTIRDDEAAAPAPTGFAVSAGSTKVQLSWDQTPKGVVVTAHEVRYRAGDDAFPADWTAIPDSAPGEANATGHTVTALSPGTDYDFELRVVNDNGSSSAATASATTRAAFTARFDTLPDTHDRTPFTVRIGFSAAIASTGVLGQGVQLTGAANTDVTAVGGGSDLFDYEVTPSGVGAVTITLPVASGCGSNGAICNTFDEPLSAELAGTVAFFGVPPSGKLVGNVTKTLDTGTLPTSPATTFVYAQSFTTGANGTGYKLDRIGIQLAEVDPGDVAAVSLLSADADGEPDAELYPLTGPLALQNGAMNYFSAPPGALLTKETTYYLQVTGAGRSEFRVRIVGGTDETEEDADSAADWLVGDDLRERTSTTDWITTLKVMKIRVDGHVLGTFPTVFLGLAPPAVAESGAATVTAAALPASDTAFTVEVSASPVSPATSSDFSLGSNTTLSFAADATASTGTVTLTAADDTAETADREITVSGSVSAAGIAGPDDVTLTVLDDDAELFTAEFSEIPETHDGQTAFTVKIRFSADIASAETLAQGVELTDGGAGGITRVGSGADHWNYPVTPAGDDDVYITLRVPSGCTDTGDICSAEGVRLATALVGRVAGPVSQDPPDGGDVPEDGTPTAPAAPTGFGVDSLDGAVRLLWRAPLSDGGSEITHHEYRQRIDNPSPVGEQWLAWSNWKTIPDSTPGGQNGESFTVTELKNDRLYEFELRAANAIGSTRSQPRREGGFPEAGELPRDLSLTPSPPDPAAAVFTRAEYTVKFTGAWTLAVTPDGVPSDAHFSRLVGGVHNGDVVFLTDTGPASPGVESMAEVGGTTLLKAEINAAGDDSLSVLEGTAIQIDRTASESFTEVALTTDHPRVTLVTMVAPTPDWFVGVSGLSMLDSLGGWRASRTVYLHPFDAGTEDGAGFSLDNAATDPPVYIASLVGQGKFSAEPIATLTFTRTSVASAPAAPADLAATPGDASVALAWTTGADGGSAIRMHQYRYRTGAAYPAAWTDIPDSAAGGANVSGFTVGGLTNGASHSFQVRARNDVGAGPAATSGAATPMPTVVVNAAPAFDSAATFTPDENQTTAGTVQASDNDTGDDVTGYAITGGADQSFFSIGSTSGLLTFNSAPNFEAPDDANADGSYLVTVQATSGTDSRVKTATQTITVTVTDVSGEAPGKPDAPTVAPASVTSLTVTWSAPANAGPAITDYDVQYREGASGSWSDGGHAGAATTATLSGLSENTSHQVQVRATSDEGTGSWSDSGSGTTDANAAPSFSSSSTFDAAENQTAAGTVLATDGDTGDDVTGYALTGGADQSFFSIGTTSGALTFDDAPNFEDAEDQGTDNTYVVTVEATSGTGTRVKTATQTITVTVTDVGGEKPAAPAAPTVSSASVTSLNVSWAAPDNAGPAITDYDVQYRAGTSGGWTDRGHSGTATTATITGLAEGTSHQVQVRATNDEGTGDWSASGAGSTDANAAPAFDSSATFNPNENQTAAGTVVASDGDTEDDIEGYAIVGGADQGKFSIHATSGALTFKAAPNFEDLDDANTDGSYQVTVRATSGTGMREKTATQTITVTVTDVSGEAPGKPDAPTVAPASVTSLTVNWSAPANAGPAITDYDVQYREGTTGNWTDGGHAGTATTATLSGLLENTSYQVQVRATNDEGTGDWSASGTGSTDANAAPAFDSSATFNPNENQTAAGTVVASDGDTEDDIEGYAIFGGADQGKFSIHATSGALTFKAAPNFEDAKDSDTDNDYVVTVEATSGTGTREKTATQTITVTVTDVSGEAPGKPDAPNVSAASVSSLTVSWSAPANAGPAIDDYDVRYREGTSGDWSDGNHTGAATTATLSGLSENTSHQVQVRATSDEGTGSWSDSGTGSTDANAAPAFSSSATFDAAENQTAAGTVLAADSDSGDDVTGYALTGGADQSFFLIGATSGALTFKAAPNFEDAEDQGTDNTYVVEVQATSGTDSRVKTATQAITVTVTDMGGEKPATPSAPTVSSASVTSLNVTWAAPDNAGPAITDYDYRHRTTSPVGNWTEVTDTTSTALSATIGNLAETTSYDVQVRATNAEGTGDWSASGTGSTDANAAPAFDSAATFTPAENQTTVGTVVASDGDTEDDIEDYTITGGADQGKFSIHATSGALTFDSAPNFEDPDDADTDGSYLVTVQATSGTGTREKTAAADIRVTLQNVIELFTQLTGPSSTDYAENGAVRVATYIASSEADRDGIAWNLGGDEAEHFSIDNPAGVLRFHIDPVDPSRFPQPPDFEAPVDDDDDGVYELIVLARAGSDLTLKTVIVTVTDENEAGAISLDTARPKMGDPPTATLTDPDGVTDGTVRWKWERSAGRNTWVVIDGAEAASYTPLATDTGAYLRVTATYTDSHAADQSARAVSAEVVAAELLKSLSVTTNASTANPDKWAMRPEFSADILHYAVGCTATGPGDTMTLTLAAANAGTRVAVNGEQADDRETTVDVTVEGDSDSNVRITLATGSDGAHTTYVVHCMDSRNPAIERTGNEPGASTELLSVYAPFEPRRNQIHATYLAIVDANGVPRWQRHLDTRATHFKAHPDGKYPYSYGHYRSSTYGYRMVILDENLDEVERVTTTDRLQRTGAHDFAIRANGNYVFEAYEPAFRDFSAYTDENDNPYGTSEATEDSVIEEVNPDGDRVFFWNSWNDMYLNDCLQHRFPDDYAHINSVQVVDEADIIASFRGCSQVWRIDRETGAGEWLLGRSNRSDAEWEADGIRTLKIVGDPEGEFCGQHSARLNPNGHLLLFDNGHHCLEDPETGDTQRPILEFSRVVEYALDPDNGEAVFVRQHCLGNICDRISASQGHIHRLDSGHWLISWGRGTSSLPVPDASVTEVDPLTNEELLAFKITHPDYYAGADVAQPTRAYPVEFVALADAPGPLRAEIAESSATSVFHLGPTDAPQVVVAFNQPVVDPDPAATTWPWVSVQGATVTSVSAHTVPGDPANTYLFTLTPTGVGPITFALVAGQSCASGGICTAAGTVLSVVPATAHTIAWVDTVAPALAATDAATVRGATLTLTFDEALASANTAASAFAVTGGTTRTISGVSVNGTAVQLTIDPPILYGESGIEVDYTAPSREALADAAGNKVASFEDRAVSNETPATTLSTGVSLSLDTASVSEGGSAKSVALTAMLNRSARPAATAVTVEVGTAGDTATEGTDYAAVDDLTLTIPAYTTGITARFTLTPTNDRIDELGESLTVTGSTAVAGLIVTPTGGLALDIEDNDPAPSLALSVNASMIDEDGGTAAVTVSTGSGSTYATDQTVRLAVAGTATENADYTIGGKTLTLPAGAGTSASMVTATVTGLDDSLDDDDETIEISGTHNGVAFGDRRTVTIEDDDDPEVTVSFAQSGYRAAEGGHVDVAVTLSAVPERQVSIPVEAEGADGADSADFSISPSSLSFGANETTGTVRVSAANDSAVDPGESVVLGFGMSLPERVSEGGIAETTVAIRDTDFTFAPAFEAGAGTAESDVDTYTVSEASSALRLSLTLETPRGARVVDVADPVVVTLATRENAGSRGTDEDYATQRRSGTFGDYGEFDLDLSFAPGDFSDDGTCGCARARKAVSVDLFNDRVYERTEVFGLRLARKSGRLSVSSQDVTVKIDEDDAEPALTLGADPGTIAEAGGTSTVTVGTGAGSTFPAAQTIRLELSGTATRGADYTIDSTSLTLPAGAGEDPSTVSTTVRALDDPFDDNAETVALSATRDGVEFASRAVAIADDDIGSTRVDLAVNPAQVREDAGATTVRVTATLDGAARAEDTALSVTVGSAGDSAVEGTDYAPVPDLTLTIDAGETTAETTFRLAPANNSAVEGARTITVDGSALGLAVRSADLTLNDDDVESTTVTLTLDPLEVRESAGSRAVRVTGTLDGGSRPTAMVVAVTVGSGGDTAAEGTDYQDVGDLELTIPANRTDGTVTFTLRPTNDRTAEGTETISVRGNVAELTVTPAELAIADDDTASTRLDLSLSPSTVSEAAAPTEVAVTGSLDAGARTSDTMVTVTVGAFTDTATQDLDYANVSTLRITVPANETTGQTTFTLSPENDAIAEGAETISVTGRASGLTVEPAALTLSDNDTASRVVTLSVDPESVSEDTPEDVTVTASLDAGARAEDTAVRLTVGAAGDTAVPGTDYERVSERTLTILSGETGGTATFLLEPLDNDSADGARTLSVTGSTTVAELRIEPATGAKIALADDDSPAVLVTPDRLTVVEAGSNTYTVELQTRPTADVTVTITGVSGDLSLDRTSLVFTGADWSDPQEVEVTAADDADSVQDPDVTLTHRASGAAEYRGLRAELVVSIRENDPSLVFSETALRVPEGETATYAVALATVPTADVTVRITGVSGDLSLDKTELAYTPGDWDDAQTITVAAAQDDDTSTDAAVTLTHRASGGGYDGIAGTLRVTIAEDDRGGGTGGGSSGGGSGGGSRNRPPVVTEPIGAQVLEIEGSVRIDATEHFRDPERRTMTFEAESAAVSVATVEVDGGVVTVGGIAHGVTTVTVTAVDHRRLRVSQSFAVSVGRQVSFASAEVSAPEGSTAMLRVTINRPRDVATSLDYVVGPDSDPATADADAADHDGVGGTVVIAARAMEATIALAVHDDTDIEPPRETFAVTLQATQAQLQDFGLGVATVRVTIDEGVCDRTRQVRNALRRSLPCAAVSATDLAARTELDLANSDLGALQVGDLSGLSGLTALDLSGNALTSLPEGLFAGLGALGEVQLQDNPGAPFTLQLELVRTDGEPWAPGPAAVVARVREGAPFAMRAALSAVNGTLSPATAVIPAGMIAGTRIRVTQAAAGATRVTAAAPAVPDTRCGVLGTYPCFQGITTAAGGTLVLFKAPPEVTDTPSRTTLAAEGDAARLDLSALFAAADGGALTYFAGSSDPTLAAASVAGDTLTLASNEDGREGAVTITVTATDSDGLSVTLTFEVTVEAMPRGLLRGWRRVLLEQAMERSAAEVD